MKYNIEEIMDKWWDKKHKGDNRFSGEFSWDEIAEFGRFLIKEIEGK